MPIRKIMSLIPGLTDSRVGQPGASAGPARLCILPGAKGKIGFIAPLSWHFCGSCNRLRLTADGQIRTCLFSQSEIDIKSPLRNGATKMELIDIFKKAAQTKPRRLRLKEQPYQCNSDRGMYAIGG
jgi:cyclic pyranopterin phosphate synthase